MFNSLKQLMPILIKMILCDYYNYILIVISINFHLIVQLSNLYHLLTNKTFSKAMYNNLLLFNNLVIKYSFHKMVLIITLSNRSQYTPKYHLKQQQKTYPTL